MASSVRNAPYDVSRQVKDAMERDDWAEVARILSEGSRLQSDRFMTQLVRRDQWDAVKQVIRCVGDEERMWNIGGILVKNTILHSVAEGNWRGIGEMPHERFLHSTLEWILQQACKRATEREISQYIVPHCEDDQLDSAVQHLVKQSKWFAVGKVLQRGVDHEQLKGVIHEACACAYDWVIRAAVIPRCHESILEFVLTELVSHNKWYAVELVLQIGVKDTQLCWAVLEACERAKVWQIRYYLLPHCTLDHLYYVMAESIRRKAWTSVRKLLQCVKDTIMTWRVDGLCVESHLLHLIAERQVNDILLFLLDCLDDSKQIIALLQGGAQESHQFFQEYWRTCDGQVQTVFSPAHPCVSNTGFQSSVVHLKTMLLIVNSILGKNKVYLVPQCAYDKLDSVLAYTQSLTENVWPYSHTWRVHRILLDPETSDVTSIPHSFTTDDQIANVLMRLFTENAWWALGKVLQQEADDVILTRILESLSYHVDTFLEILVANCKDTQADIIMATMVHKGQWDSVATLLSLTGDRKLEWTIEGVTVETHILQMLAARDWRPVGTEHELGSLGKLLKQSVSDVIFTRILDHLQTGNYAEMFLENLMAISTDTQTDLIMETMVHKGQWYSVSTLLSLTGDRKLVWTIEGVKVETTVLQMLAARDWCRVKTTIQGGDSQQTRWLIHILCLHADEKELEVYVLPYCSENQLDFILRTLVEENLWRAVGHVLTRSASGSLKRCAVEEACKHYYAYGGDDDVEDPIIKHIIPHCAEHQLDSVLTTLVERRLWQAVGEVLKRGVSDSVKRWAVMEACQHVGDSAVYYDVYDHIEENILPHCADDQLDSVLTTLVERRLWQAVGEVLKRGVSDSVKRWAVMEACQHVDDSAVYYDVYDHIEENILPHCADDQLDSVLTTLVERRMWRAVEVVLNRGVSDSVKRWAIAEVFTKYDEDDWNKSEVDIYDDDNDDDYYNGERLIGIILPHCADDQLDSVLTTLVERRLWRYVGQVLKRGVSDSVKRWAVMEACQHADDSAGYYAVYDYIEEIILPHCADDQLDSALTTLVERRLWQSVQRVLERVAGDLNKEFAGQKTCEHCRSAGIYFSKYHFHDSNSLVNISCTPHRADCNVNSPTSALSKKNECTAVRNMSGREVSDAQRRENIRAAFRHADENTLIENILPHYVYDSIHSALKMLASRGFWSAFLVLLHNSIIDTLYMWAVAKDTASKDEVFWDMVRNPCDGVKKLTPAMWRSVTWSGLQRSLKQLLDWNTPLCEVLCESLLGTVKEIWLSGREWEINMRKDTVLEEALSTVEHLHQLIAPVLMECKKYYVSNLLSCTEGVRREYAERRSNNCLLFQLYFMKTIVLHYYKRKAWEQMTNTILVALTTDPVVPDVQSVALRVMLRLNRWDIVRHACLSGVCEQDRRQLFLAAVKQRQWSAVKRWADHTLYDDQRLWALGEARQGKRWDVYLKLADHGLSEWERVGVLFRVTMHADWKLVRRMLTTVADVTDMIDLLTNTPGASSKLGAKKFEERMSDFTEFKKVLTQVFEKTLKEVFEKTLKKDTVTLKALKTLAKRGKWWVVLHNIRHQPNLQHARRALKAAVSSEAWHAVMQLVRLETDVTRRDSLFRDMVRLRQWAVCRELLEQGVSTELCLELLPALIEHCQWTLVAMTMKYEMDDERRKNIVHQALMTREGSVVWVCITKLQTRLSVTERKEIFKLAFNREVWQAVKPLIEEKDVTGIRHRDTALLEAIEQHQWDVVDHCQRHHADINMKDDDGHTPIHRAARKGDWEAVKELTVRDGDPNLLDRGGLSVLHRAVGAEQWDAVKLLIQYHGDIHQAAQYTYYPSDSRTPLGMLIDARQKQLIKLTLMWCPDQWKSVSEKGETVLHAAFLSDWIDLVYYLIARKVDPLAVTMRGHTTLCYAVLCKDCPQRMVAECIKLGFSTHQPHITDTARVGRTFRLDLLTEEGERLLMSPLVLAVMRGLPVVTQMLCEAGACSIRQLCELNVHLVELTKPNTDKGRTCQRAFSDTWQDIHNFYYSFDTELMEQSADYLRQVSSTPRSLVSTCRLVISRRLTLSKTRHRDIAQLPLSPMMKNYLMFSDLTDPRFPDLSYRGKE